MTVADVAGGGPSPAGQDVPRRIVVRVSVADRAFRAGVRAAGFAVLVLTAGILVFLLLQALPALRAVGTRFFTTSSWFISNNQFGIAAILPLGVLIAVIALLIAVPAGLACALYISEYAPPQVRRALIAVIDLMAAIPSIIVALFGLYFLMPRILGFDAWLVHHVGFIPVFSVSGPNYASTYVGATFIAGVLVSLMVIPIVTALSRQVFSQAPTGEREAAYALGATRWGMIRTVVLPYGRAGVIGASMLGLGRALGETIAVSFILTPPLYHFTWHVLKSGGNSITFMIATQWFEAGTKEQSALLAAGLVLFVMTLAVNTIAAVVISRSRSGATASAD